MDISKPVRLNEGRVVFRTVIAYRIVFNTVCGCQFCQSDVLTKQKWRLAATARTQ